MLIFHIEISCRKAYDLSHHSLCIAECCSRLLSTNFVPKHKNVFLTASYTIISFKDILQDVTHSFCMNINSRWARSCSSENKPQWFCIRRIMQIMIFKVIITAYSENHMKTINILRGRNAELQIVTANGTLSYEYMFQNQLLSKSYTIFRFENIPPLNQ